MLQQTRVETVIPYFERWMACFPTIKALAEANLQDVLAAWEGLGYYSRARNLQRAAQIIMTEYSGELPAHVPSLLKLPGIGHYTAGAISSIAFGLDEPALDGNIRRVMARLFDVSLPERSKEGEQRLWDLARQYLPAGRAGDYNQALMDLGATLCTPHAPKCPVCPLVNVCQSHQLGNQSERPVRAARSISPHYTVTAAVIRRGDLVLIAQRHHNGLLGGLWEFPGGKLQPDEHLASCLQREIREELGVDVQVDEALGIYRHAYTHFRVTLHAFMCNLSDGVQPQALEHLDLRWVVVNELSNYPMGKIDRQISLRLMEIR
jgi:A/G-specific adenine glycosylase